MTETKELKLVKTADEKKARRVPTTIEKLDMVKAHRLITLMLEDFTEKRMTFKEYATYASEKLNMTVTAHQVGTRVAEFEIPHGDKPTPPDPSEFTAMLLKHEVQIGELTERMAKMEAWINNTFPNVSGKKMVG